MKLLSLSFAASLVFGSAFCLTGCSTSGVQETRGEGVERRQDRIDSRTSARQERWKVRGEREDARAAARFDSW